MSITGTPGSATTADGERVFTKTLADAPPLFFDREAAGLRAGDQFLDVAGITAATYRGDPGQIAEGLRAHEGRAVAVAVLRAGMPTEVTLTPRTWAGPGLLGCQLRSLT